MQEKKLDKSKTKATETTRSKNEANDKANSSLDIGMDLKVKTLAKSLKLEESSSQENIEGKNYTQDY